MEWNSKTKIIYGPKNIGSPKIKPRFFILIACAALIFLGFCFGVYWTISHQKFSISEVSIHGAVALKEAEVRDALDEYFSRKIFFDITRQQYFFASLTAIEGALRFRFPRIKDISIAKNFPHSMEIVIRERLIWGTVCGSAFGGKTSENSASTTPLALIENESCVYIDETGFAFAPAPFWEGFLTKKIFIDGWDINIGESAVPENGMILYENMIRSFKAAGVSVTAMLFESDLPRDARVYAGKWYGLIARDVDPEKLAEVLKPMLQTELKGKLDELQYIDLRFGNKVFYKFRAQEN